MVQEMLFKEKVYARRTDEDWWQKLTLSLRLRWAKNRTAARRKTIDVIVMFFFNLRHYVMLQLRVFRNFWEPCFKHKGGKKWYMYS